VNFKTVSKIVLIVAVALLIVPFAATPLGIPQNYLELLFRMDLLVWNVWLVMKLYERYMANLPDDIQSRVSKNNRPKAIVAMFLICVVLLRVMFPSVPIMVSFIAGLLFFVVLFWFFIDMFWATRQRKALKKSLAS